MTVKRRILVTNALPYATGDIHLGHLYGYIQADMWVRFQRMRGHEVHYVCGVDAHGTGTMLLAEKRKLSSDTLAEQLRQAQEQAFRSYHVDFDHYSSTHTATNEAMVDEIFEKLKEQGLIQEKLVNQFYDAEKGMFLADRFIKGDCPRCKAPDQYGDNCEVCGAVYAADELGNPKSTLSGSKPIKKDSLHYFLTIGAHTEHLKAWVPAHTQPEVANKLAEWLEDELKPWDISRDAPYFGFQIPGHKDKYFYVWLDAPVGYMAAFKELCEEKGYDFDAYWRQEQETELYHFIGKDIINFHALFWPMMLEASGFRTPTQVFTSGFITLNGQKMSKSRGIFIKAEDFARFIDPELLRYYYASKMTQRVEDSDVNLDDVRQKVNSDLVNKFVNIASRTAKFVHKHFDGKLTKTAAHPELISQFQQQADQIAKLYDERQFNHAVREIMALADLANHFINEQQPWAIAKDESRLEEVHGIVSTSLNMFRILAIYLKPILPMLTKKVEAFLSVSPFSWQDSQTELLGHQIAPFKPMMKRIEADQIQKLVNACSAQSTEATQNSQAIEKPNKVEQATTAEVEPLDIKTLDKVDLRIGKILSASHVEGSNKLIEVRVDLGELGERTIFSGIRGAYQAEDLLGKLTLVVANLKPRKMRFGVSEGMLLCAGVDDNALFLLSPDSGATPGMPVK